MRKFRTPEEKAALSTQEWVQVIQTELDDLREQLDVMKHKPSVPPARAPSSAPAKAAKPLARRPISKTPAFFNPPPAFKTADQRKAELLAKKEAQRLALAKEVQRRQEAADQRRGSALNLRAKSPMLRHVPSRKRVEPQKRDEVPVSYVSLLP